MLAALEATGKRGDGKKDPELPRDVLYRGQAVRKDFNEIMRGCVRYQEDRR